MSDQILTSTDSRSSSDSGFVLASVDSVKEHLTPNIQLTIQGKDRALILSVDVHTLDKILPNIGRLL